MYTAFPDTDDKVKQNTSTEEIPAGTKNVAKIYERLLRFSREHSGTDFAGLSAQTERTQYTELHRSMKRKGGRPPHDFALVEDLIDFQKLVKEGKLEEALPYYYRLSRLVY